MVGRSLRDQERSLVRVLLGGGPTAAAYLSRLEEYAVEDMDDGGMGSILFVGSHPNSNRELGVELGAAEFTDSDGIFVLVYLNADNFGELYEMEIWKGTGTPVISYPNPEDLRPLGGSSSSRR